MNQIQKRSLIFKLAGVSCLLGFGYTSYRISQLNSQLGLQKIEYQIAKLKNEFDQENLVFNQDNKFHFILQSLTNKVSLLQIKANIYILRLLNDKNYKDICQKINNRLIVPLVGNYDSQDIFQYSDLINDLKEKKQFNNKLGQKLVSIQNINQRIKQENKSLLQQFGQLQEKLMTDHVYALNKTNKEKIDIIYSYFQQRKEYLLELIEPKQKDIREQKENNESLYFKLQFL